MQACMHACMQCMHVCHVCMHAYMQCMYVCAHKAKKKGGRANPTTRWTYMVLTQEIPCYMVPSIQVHRYTGTHERAISPKNECQPEREPV